MKPHKHINTYKQPEEPLLFLRTPYDKLQVSFVRDEKRRYLHSSLTIDTVEEAPPPKSLPLYGNV